MIVAVVLSAGESRRMGSPKALLPIGGETFIERIVASLGRSKVGKIIVVLGHNAEGIRSQVAHLPVTWVVNKDYAKGQLSSLIAAVRSLQESAGAPQVDGILVHLVDHPFLDSRLVDEMIDRFYESKKLIVLPRYQGRRGHPVIFSTALFAELLGTPLEEGAKAVVRAHRNETLEIETGAEGVTVDIDTEDEYRKFVRGKECRS
ncbi:MAG: nucleotidyltransferase family protein [Deltaproteobacteria bacterium]|nr:nucleotidyltransferase family protein [Deltaproteobacteria bacterium]